MVQSLPIRSSFTEAASPFLQAMQGDHSVTTRLEFPRSRYLNCTRSTNGVKAGRMVAEWKSGLRVRPAAAFDHIHDFGPQTC